MIIVRTVKKVREEINRAKGKGKVIGFVPTMGALHQGHLSLVRAARKETDFVAVSIFVNPTQFAPGEDYRSYPRSFSKDQNLLKDEGVDLVFYPTPEQMYQKDFSLYIDETALSKYLCGGRRVGHFKGVCTVVGKLFNIVAPDISYFGQKDYQQAQIIKRMVRDLNFSIKIRALPIIREKDGLAMSSRNKYLNEEERKKATVLYRSLRLAYKLIKTGERSPYKVMGEMKAFINKEVPFAKIDYINIVHPYTLEDVTVIKAKVVVALAVYIGGARLIDNMVI